MRMCMDSRELRGGEFEAREKAFALKALALEIEDEFIVSGVAAGFSITDVRNGAFRGWVH